MSELYPELQKGFGKAVRDLRIERMRQNVLWGIQDHRPSFWLAILGEEYGEVCRAVCEMEIGKEKNPKWWKNYREELIHVAAVAIQAVECFDRNVKIEDENHA